MDNPGEFQWLNSAIVHRKNVNDRSQMKPWKYLHNSALSAQLRYLTGLTQLK